MQSDQQYFRRNPGHPLADELGSTRYMPNPNPPLSPFFGQNVDFTPSKNCPRNFVIFDRTDNRSQIMYHPHFGYNVEDPTRVRAMAMANDPQDVSSFMKEDSADIDVLLSLDGEDEDEEEELSTARTGVNDVSDTADSCSSSRLKLSSRSHKLKGGERKRREMRKMVESLRGIVPGGDGMNTVAVIDEAVKYLKSLKVEVQKIGVGNLNN